MTGGARKLAGAAIAGAVFVGAALAVSDWLDLGATGFLALITLGAVAAVGFDGRRRSMQAHRRERERQTRLEGQLDELRGHVAEEVARVGESVADVVATRTGAVGDAVASVGKQLDASVDQVALRTSTTVSNAVKELKMTVPKSTRAHVALELLTTYRQIEALMRLRDVVDVTGPTPRLREWAASADVVMLLVDELQRLRPTTVVECGSGASTVWMAMASRTFGLDTRIVALEHDEHYAAATRQALADCGVGERAEVVVAPLEPITIGDFVGPWYAASALEDLRDIGLVFVDGPPAGSGPMARFPALPALHARLAPTATIVLDDTIREEETDIAASWVDAYPEFDRTDEKFEKGACVLRRIAPSPTEPA